MTARDGDIYRVDGGLYRSHTSGILGDTVTQPGPGQDGWTPVNLGTTAFPKPHHHTDIRSGDVTYDSDTGTYSRAEVDPDGVMTFETFDYSADWMTNIRDHIGDRRLGDLILPGTHDSATSGCNNESYLVNQNELFQFAQGFDPQILANWSLTQSEDLRAQLEAGFRMFDLRIADVGDIDGTFRWWHGITGDTIEEGLEDIASFSETHPGEVILLRFGHFASPGNADSPTLPIATPRKDVLADILIEKLSHRLVDITAFPTPNNPTVNQVLATGRNVIADVGDSYIRSRHPRFFGDLAVNQWVGRTNPEDLFEERSGKLNSWLTRYPDRITALSGCTTPAEKNIVGAMIRLYGDDPIIREIISILFPELLDVDPDLMSFEGQFYDLLTTVREGTNTGGMRARHGHLYTHGGSVHYAGVNDMIPYWVARPGLFKLNEIHVDDFVSSTAVDSAIRANRGEIGRQVSLGHQGNAKDGYYVWDEDDAQTEGGTDGLGCEPVLARYQVTSQAYHVDTTWTLLPPKSSVSFTEGEFPPDADVTLSVSSGDEQWYELYTNNLQVMVEGHLDMYLRGAALQVDSGRAYVSYTYDLFGTGCDVIPSNGAIAMISW